MRSVRRSVESLPSIAQARCFFHRRIEAQGFVCAFAVFMPSCGLDSHEHFVPVNLFDGTFLFCPVDANSIACFYTCFSYRYEYITLVCWGKGTFLIARSLASAENEAGSTRQAVSSLGEVGHEFDL